MTNTLNVTVKIVKVDEAERKRRRQKILEAVMKDDGK